MHWEFWTKKLDEEDVIENGEFVSLRVFSFQLRFSFSFHCQCTLLSRCHKQEVCFNRAES